MTKEYDAKVQQLKQVIDHTHPYACQRGLEEFFECLNEKNIDELMHALDALKEVGEGTDTPWMDQPDINHIHRVLHQSMEQERTNTEDVATVCCALANYHLTNIRGLEGKEIGLDPGNAMVIMSPNMREAELWGAAIVCHNTERKTIVGGDLKYASFAQGMLRGFNMQDCNLQSIAGEAMHMIDMRLDNCNLTSSRMRRAGIHNSEFHMCDFKSASLVDATIQNSSFGCVGFTFSTSLFNTVFANCRFFDCNLHTIDWRCSLFVNCRFINCKIPLSLKEKLTKYGCEFTDCSAQT